MADEITIYERSQGKSHVHKPGEVLRHQGGYYTVVEMTKKLCRCEEPWDDSYDEQVWKNVITARPATPEEAKSLMEEDAKSLRMAAIKVRVNQIKQTILDKGEYPSGLYQPEGQVYFDTMDIYGGGSKLVVGPEYVWSVQNNGMDGDDWGRNNVRTGGAGAIGYRLKLLDAGGLDAEIAMLEAEYKALKN